MFRLRSSDRSSHTDRAVSPVIGVVLLTAITVILAAAIAVFVLDFSSQLDDSGPTVEWECSQSGAGDELTIQHRGPDHVEADRLTITIDAVDAATQFSGTVRATDAVTIAADTDGNSLAAGDTVSILYRGGEGGTTVLGEYRVR